MPDAAPDRPSRHLAAAAFLLFLAAIALGYFCRLVLTPVEDRWLAERWLALGLALGCLGLLYWHRFRGLGLATITLAIAFAVAAVCAIAQSWPDPVIAAIAGFLEVAILRLLMFVVFAQSGRWTDFALIGLVLGIAIGVVAAGQWPCTRLLTWSLGVLAVVAGILLFRPTFEFASEPLLWLMYRIRAFGPGLQRIPQRGPCLVVANHACWFDPLFLAKVLPRPITPMMTARFYDKPVLHFLCRHVFRAIRVPEKALKQDVPEEITLAIAALDRGECVVIFPEGYLRRGDDKLIRRFGRGVWQMLVARPQTPVFCCWIEGGWGSFCSYWNGNPTRGKRPDFRRRIGIAVPEPSAVETETLANHWATRNQLMNRVLAAREILDGKAEANH